MREDVVSDEPERSTRRAASARICRGNDCARWHRVGAV